MKEINQAKNIRNIKNIKADYLVIGNSAAGLAAAESIRKIDKKSSITILSGERHFNYSKPLITYFLAGKSGADRLFFKDKSFYSDNDIELVLNATVTDIDPVQHNVIVEILIDRADIKKSCRFSYYKALIASGGKPIIPEIKIIGSDGKTASLKDLARPFVTGDLRSIEVAAHGADGRLGGVFTLTTLDDAIAVKKYIELNGISSATILGGGLIGLKAAEAFLELGIKINVIEFSKQILSASFDEIASEIITKKIEDAGSNVITNSTIDEIFTDPSGSITGYSVRSGEKFPCGLLIIAVGVAPAVEILGSFVEKVRIDGGIIVNDFMETSMEDLYAAGDIIRSFDKLSGKNKNIAIWPLAVRQGSIAGNNMAGNRKKYNGGFFMNSVEILGVPVISIGLSSIGDNELENIKTYRNYNREKNIYRKIVVKDDRVIGAILAGSIERAGIYAGLISNEVDITDIKDNIAREDFGIIQLPAGYRKHLVIGEGIEV